MRIVVCGSRNAEDPRQTYAALDYWHARAPITRIAHGAARGVDSFADHWAKKHGIPVQSYPYLKEHGRAGGPIRNGRMLRAENPQLVIAMPGNEGTEDCVRQARKMGFPVVEVSLDFGIT